MKVCLKLAVLIGLIIVIAARPLVAQEQSGQSTNKPMRIRVGSGIALARIETEPLPQYPQPAIDNQIEGTVVLHLVIGDDGAVKQEEATSGPVELRESALNSVKQWHFGKTFLNQQPLEVDKTIALVYALHPTPTVSVNNGFAPTPSSNSQSPSKGVIDGRTYKNSSIGLEFTPAPGLNLADMNSAAGNTIGVQAQTVLDVPPYGLTVFTADELAH